MIKLSRQAQFEEDTRTYTISAHSEVLDGLEKVLSCAEYLGNIGASRGIIVGVDGDGIARIKVKKDKGELETIGKDKLEEFTNSGDETIRIGLG